MVLAHSRASNGSVKQEMLTLAQTLAQDALDEAPRG